MTVAEFYESESDGTLMIRISAIGVDEIATEERKQHYPAAWEKFKEQLSQVVEVALENQEAFRKG